MRSLIKARGTIGMSKGRGTWPNKGTEPVKNQNANKKPKISVSWISQTPCFSASGQYNLIPLSLGLLWILQLLSVKTLSGGGQRRVRPGGEAVARQLRGLLKAKGATCGSCTCNYFTSLCLPLVSFIWSKTSKSLQNREIHLRSERVSLCYVRLPLLYLLVQILSM